MQCSTAPMSRRPSRADLRRSNLTDRLANSLVGRSFLRHATVDKALAYLKKRPDRP
jgi:hypothetical protein